MSLPEHHGKVPAAGVVSEDDIAAPTSEEVWAEVEADGQIHSCASPPADPDGWGSGKVATWIPVLLDGRSDAVEVGGEEKLVPTASTPSTRPSGPPPPSHRTTSRGGKLESWRRQRYRFARPLWRTPRQIARLLHDFNTEYEEETPPVAELTGHAERMLREGEMTVLLAGEGPDGLALLRFRPSVWTEKQEVYLQELYVVPGCAVAASAGP